MALDFMHHASGRGRNHTLATLDDALLHRNWSMNAVKLEIKA